MCSAEIQNTKYENILVLQLMCYKTVLIKYMFSFA